MSKTKEYTLLTLSAVGAGFINGLVGAGGGIVLYFILGALYGRGAKENLTVASFSVMFFCLVSLFFYEGNNALTVENILRIAVPSALGGICGALLLKRIPQSAVKKIFSAVLIVGGILMIVR